MLRHQAGLFPCEMQENLPEHGEKEKWIAVFSKSASFHDCYIESE